MGMGIGKPAPEIRSLITQTTDDITLYVRTTGSDSNHGLSTDKPLLTIQAAIDLVPRYVRHNVLVDIGEGTFGAVDINSFVVTESGNFTIQGVKSQPTNLTTGTATGEASSATETPGPGMVTMTDSSAEWTTNELAGMILHNTTLDRYGYIVSNTDDDIVAHDVHNSLIYSGNNYEILEHKTILNGTGSLSMSPLEVLHCSSLTTEGLVLKNLAVKPTSVATIGFLFYNSLIQGEFLYNSTGGSGAYYGFAMGLAGLPCRLEHCHSDYAYLGAYIMFRTGGTYASNNNGASLILKCSATNNVLGGTAGLVAEQATGATVENFSGYDLGVGFQVWSSNIYITDSYLYDIARDGVQVDTKDSADYWYYGHSVVSLDFLDINEFANRGILAAGGSTIYARTVQGTGATGSTYGADIRDGVTLNYCLGTNTVTGDDDDFTVNKGVTGHDWTEINSAGEMVVNTDEGTRARYVHEDLY